MAGKKRPSAAVPLKYQVELVYAPSAAPGGFGLLADLLLEEILRQRQTTAEKSTDQAQPVSTQGTVNYD